MYKRIGMLVVLGLQVTMAAFAAEAREKLKYGTREQYRACLESEDNLLARRKQLDEQLAENTAALKKIQEDAATIIEEQKRLDLTDELAVRVFNKRVDERNASVMATNEKAEKLKAEAEAFHELALEHNKKCSTLIFKIADQQAVRKERQAAGTGK